MHRRLKERLIGAAVLVMLAVIFIPMILNDTTPRVSTITDTNIPTRQGVEFNSRMVPVAEPPAAETPTPSTTPAPTEEETVAEAATPEPAETTGQAAPPTTAAGTPPATTVTRKEDIGLKAWVVQLGVFSDAGNAESLNKQLRKAGFAAFVEPLKQDGSQKYRVRVGPELVRGDADALLGQIRAKLKLDGIIKEYP